jgi:hypothetical protein
MYNFRLPLQAFVTLLILLFPCTHAQSQRCLDGGAIPVDTFAVTLSLDSSFTGLLKGVSVDRIRAVCGKSNAFVNWIVVGSQLTGGQIGYSIDPASIACSGDDSFIDNFTTSQLFSMMAQATVQRGIELGYTLCEATVHVWHPACVERIGSGTTTHFLSCSSGCGYRAYAAICGTGTPALTLVGVEGGECSGPLCESTVTEEFEGAAGGISSELMLE